MSFMVTAVEVATTGPLVDPVRICTWNVVGPSVI